MFVWMEDQISLILIVEKLLVVINLNPVYTRCFLTFWALNVFLARFALLWCESNKRENEREKEVSRWSRELPGVCLKCHQSYETKAFIHRFTILWDSFLMQSLHNIKMVDHMKNRSTSVKGNSVKGNSVSEGARSYVRRLWWLIMENRQLWSGKKMQCFMNVYPKVKTMKTCTGCMQKLFVWI